MTIPTAAPHSDIIRWVDFNMHQDHVVVASDRGVRVFNCNPLQECFHLTEDQVGSVKIATILHRTNLVAIVAGGIRPKFAPNTMMIWDNVKRKFVMEITVPGGPILNIFLNSSRIVLVQSKKVNIFSLQPTANLRGEETGYNPAGLAAMGGESHSALLAFPFYKCGAVQILALENVGTGNSLAPNVIEAHRGEIAALAVNAGGSLLATGSTKGTVIRIFDTRNRHQVNELRRGTDPSTLHCLSFSPCGSYLAASSDKGTVHIFGTRDKPEGNFWATRKIPFDDTKRSLAQFPLSDDSVAAIGFIAEDSEERKRQSSGDRALAPMMSVAAICKSGSFHRFSFNKDGICERQGFDYLLQLGSEQDFWTSPF